MNTFIRKSMLAAILCATSAVVVAQQADMHKGMGMGDMKMGDAKQGATSLASGEVKGIDKSGKTITLKHGQIKSESVQMGPMTMTFPVQSPALLKGVKSGDKVKFNVENVNGVAMVTVLEPQKK
ncbi:copper-binding protein [Noviherbaspirillum galbum]|uniref:Copper-binding protein n=1 Tax=Noviherbaspirillum galbum TaxID=2709383 RepID=A0A6B3SVC0_9BURK|nr:copper-binding protein [Noviherbaspirillum galbum]NEX63335.1 copper-binding protein [Noviherbaspirillum galbum]